MLSIQYRQRDEKGDWVGGLMYYIAGIGPKWKWLAMVYAALAGIACFGIGNMSQVNAITGSITNAITAFFTINDSGITVIHWVIGLSLAALVALILLGGIKRIGKVAEKLVPIMSLFYVLVCLGVIFSHAGNIGGAFAKIFTACVQPRAVLGAASGIALKEALVWGLRRSAFSNEAGLGSAAIAHAAADTPSAVHQGLYGIFEVFVDTIVICSMTALTIICSGVDINFGVKPGSELITAAVATIFGGKLAALFVAVALILFAFSTVLGWALYGSRCAVPVRHQGHQVLSGSVRDRHRYRLRLPDRHCLEHRRYLQRPHGHPELCGSVRALRRRGKAHKGALLRSRSDAGRRDVPDNDNSKTPSVNDRWRFRL